jgi:hypothetical protein
MIHAFDDIHIPLPPACAAHRQPQSRIMNGGFSDVYLMHSMSALGRSLPVGGPSAVLCL